MATVRGTFELNERPATASLRRVRTDAYVTEKSLAKVGREMDRIGNARQIAQLDRYDSRLRKVGRTAVTTSTAIRREWGATERAVVRSVAVQEKAIGRLETRLQRLAVAKATPHVDVDGVAEAVAQVSVLERRLAALDRKRVNPNIGLGASGFGGGGSRVPGGGGSSFAKAGGRMGMVTKFGLMGLAAAPFATSLGGAATGIAGSAGMGLAGAGAVGVGGAGVAATALGGLLSVAIPAAKGLSAASDALKDYNDAVKENGRNSREAKQAMRELNRARRAAPGSGRFLSARERLSSNWMDATAGGRRDILGTGTNFLNTANRLVPQASGISNGIAGAVRTAGAGFSDFAGSKQTSRFMASSGSSAIEAIPHAASALQNVMGTAMNLTVATKPFFDQSVRWIDKWTGGWEDSTSNIYETREEVGKMVDHLKSWGGLTKATAELLKDLLVSGAPSGKSMVERLTKQLETWDEWIKRNPAKMTRFFNQAEKSTVAIASAAGTLAEAFFKIGTLLAPLLTKLGTMVDLLDSIGAFNPVGLMAMFAAFKAYRGVGGLGGMMGGMGGMGGPAGGGGMGGPMVFGGGGMGGRRGPVQGPRTSTGKGPSRIPAGRAAAGRFGGAFAGFLAPMIGINMLLGGLGAQSQQSGFGGVQDRARGLVNGVIPGLVNDPKTAAQYSTGQAKHDREELASILSDKNNDFVTAMMNSGRYRTAGAAPVRTPGGINLPASLMPKYLPGTEGKRVINRSSITSEYAGSLARSGRENLKGADSSAATAQARAQIAQARRIRQSLKAEGSDAAMDFYNAFMIRSKKGGPEAAMRKVTAGVRSQMKTMSKEGSATFAQATLNWAKSAAKSNPRLVDEYKKMVEKMRGNFKNLDDNVAIVNGKIYKRSDSSWKGIRKIMRTQSYEAEREVTGNMGKLEQSVLGQLRAFGYDRGEAMNIMKGANSEGGANVGAATGGTGSARINSGNRATGTGAAGVRSGGAAARGMRVAYAGGGRIPGLGRQDNVPIGGGNIAAPGELVVNRHTEKRVDGALRAVGTSLSAEVNRERTKHSSPGPMTKRGIPKRELKHAYGGRYALGGILAAGQLGQSMGLSVGEQSHFGGVAPVHTDGSYHYKDQAIDVSGSPDLMNKFFHAVESKWQGKGLAELFYDPVGYYIKYDQRVPGAIGGHSDHVHAAITSDAMGRRGMAVPNMAGGAGMAPAQRISLKAGKSGLPGAMGAMSGRAMAGAAKGMEDAVNRRIGGRRGGGAFTGRGMAQFGSINRVYEEHNSANGDWGGQKLPLNTIAALAEAAGGATGQDIPGMSMARMTIGESNRRPGATGIDPGGTKGLGLWMITTSFNDPLIAKYGGEEQMRNPVKNAMAMAEIYKSQGQGAWYGDGSVGNRNEHYGHARGGRVAWGGWHRRGGSGVVSGPTVFGAGEGLQKEHVSIRPVRPAGKKASGGNPQGSGGVNLTFTGDFHVRNDADIDKIVSKVAKELNRALDRNDGDGTVG